MRSCVRGVLILALGVGLAACGGSPPENPKDYVAQLTAARAEKDAAFLRNGDSPVPAVRRSDLLPLAYYRIDQDYDVPAVLKPVDDKTVIQMATSSGTPRDMRRVGTLAFSVKGRPLKLTAFVEVGAKDLNQLFVPFADLTTGSETYPGGRYLDLDRTATGIYDLDFNKAYDPYCAYNPTWECPYPPKENRLPIAIRAGEKLKHPEQPPKS